MLNKCIGVEIKREQCDLTVTAVDVLTAIRRTNRFGPDETIGESEYDKYYLFSTILQLIDVAIPSEAVSGEAKTAVKAIVSMLTSCDSSIRDKHGTDFTFFKSQVR